MVDFGQYLAGPYGPMLLADLGADVIKVEPTRGDGMRGGFIGPFMGCQRGKRDVALDLKQPDGVRLALELVATADMVHHNMTLGTADRLGIGYEHCKAVCPDILYCNTYMYGPVGPLAHFGGVDPLAQAAAGLEWEEGPVAEGNPPLWYRYGHGDVAAAIPSVTALLIALYHRTRTGEGQSMWASLLHGAMLYTADSWLAADGRPSPRPRSIGSSSASTRCTASTRHRTGGCSSPRCATTTGSRCAGCCGATNWSTTHGSRPGPTGRRTVPS